MKVPKQEAIRLMAALYEAQARGVKADMCITPSGDVFLHAGDVAAMVDGRDSAEAATRLLNRREGWA